MPSGEYKSQWERVLIALCAFKLQVNLLWESALKTRRNFSYPP